MKRKLLGVFGLILLVSLFFISLVSAGWFGETWGKITGNAILEGGNIIINPNFDEGLEGWRKPSSSITNNTIIGGDNILQVYVTGPSEGNCWASGPNPSHCNSLLQTFWTDKPYENRSFKARADFKAEVGFTGKLELWGPPFGSNLKVVRETLEGTGEWVSVETDVLALDDAQDYYLDLRLVSYSPDAAGTVTYWDNIELVEVFEEEENATCVDSDDGLDYYVRGEAYSSIQGFTQYDECNGDILTEHFCEGEVSYGELLREEGSNPYLVTTTGYVCPNGCIDGACIAITENMTCTDGDGGEDYYEGGSITTRLCGAEGVVEVVDTCKSSNATNAEPVLNGPVLLERFCTGDESDPCLAHTYNKYDCPNGCSNGACNEITHGNCENVMIRATDFKLDGNIEEVDLQVRVNNNWMTFCSDKSEGGECNYLEIQINIGEIFTTSKDSVSNAVLLNIARDGVFYDQSNLMKGNVYLFEEDSDDHVVAKWCDGSNVTVDSCQSVVDFMLSPTDLIIDGKSWKLRYNNSWQGGGYSDNYYAYFTKKGEYGGYYGVSLEIDVIKGNDVYSIEDRLNDLVGYNICEKERIYLEGPEMQTIYLCENLWDIAMEGQELNVERDRNEEIEAVWTSGNKLFRAYIFSERDSPDCYDVASCIEQEQEIQHRMQLNFAEVLEDLMDNDADWAGEFYLDWEAEEFLKYFLDKCSSDIKRDEEYVGSWKCKTEPVICPPHGEQTEVCTRWNNNLDGQELREVTIQCNPGICSGCYVPRWFGYEGENKCIPYGMRFESERSETEMLYEGTDLCSNGVVEWNLSILSDSTARMVYGEGCDYDYEFDEILREGYSYGIYVEGQDLKFVVREIYLSNSDSKESYVRIEIVEDFPAYCDIDGRVKRQKDNALGAEWAKCQNNYECASNICSYSECVDLRGLVDEAKGIRAFFVKIGCRLRHLFDGDDYNQCLWDNLGEVEGEDESDNYLIKEDIYPFEYEDYMFEDHKTVDIYVAEYKYGETLGENRVIVFASTGDDSWREDFEREIFEQEMGGIYDYGYMGGGVVMTREDYDGRDVIAWTSNSLGVAVNLHNGVSSDNLLDAYLDKYPSDLEAPTNTIALHKFYNAQTDTNYYVTEIDNDYSELIGEIARGEVAWQHEGVIGYIYEDDQSNTIALHKFYNAQTDTNYYVTEIDNDYSELIGEIARGEVAWQHEGVIGYIYEDDQ
jgi:hypothetical protein